uniref:Thyroglobulin type-1 domain-containing protein n=1 Tax=Esox lucius TaxID=8010 RepID=A0A3P8ZMA9_ESOLU
MYRKLQKEIIITDAFLNFYLDLTPCEQDTANCPHVLGRCCPKCDNQGQYTPLQCCGSTGYCRCVTTLGHSIPGTLTPPGRPRPNCQVRKGRCV